MYSLIPTRTNSLFDSFFSEDFPKWTEAPQGMSTDIAETETGYAIEMDLPGYDKTQVSISAKSDVLTVTAEKKSETEEKADSFVRKERFFGKRERSFSLKGIDQDSIDASFENGVLKITLSKEAKYLTDKMIEIK